MHPELLSWGPINVHTWGVMIAIAFMVVNYLVTRTITQSKLMTPDDVLEGGIVAIFSGVLGARMAFIIEYRSLFKNDLREIFMIQHGGLVFYGGLILGLISLAIWCRIRKFCLIKVLDATAPAMLIGIGIGRIGCFFNGCCYGRPTFLPWAVHFPDVPGLVHPTQLYEFIGTTVVGLLAYALKPKLTGKGQTLGLCLLLYGVERFLVEMVRVTPSYFGLTSAQWISIALVTSGTYLLCFIRRN